MLARPSQSEGVRRACRARRAWPDLALARPFRSPGFGSSLPITRLNRQLSLLSILSPNDPTLNGPPHPLHSLSEPVCLYTASLRVRPESL
jgi:hypothetical protein